MGTISVILLIAILGGGVYFFIKKSKESKTEPKKPINWDSIKSNGGSTKVPSSTKEFDTSSLDEKKKFQK